MLKNIKNVMYEKKSMISLAEYFQLEIFDDKNVLKYIDNMYPDSVKNPKIQNIADELVIEYFDKLFRIIDGWENKYVKDNIVDGMDWQLQITYKDGNVRHYSGKNAFPSNFEYLDKIKYEIINKILESKV